MSDFRVQSPSAEISVPHLIAKTYSLTLNHLKIIFSVFNTATTPVPLAQKTYSYYNRNKLFSTHYFLLILHTVFVYFTLHRYNYRARFPSKRTRWVAWAAQAHRFGLLATFMCLRPYGLILFWWWLSYGLSGILVLKKLWLH